MFFHALSQVFHSCLGRQGALEAKYPLTTRSEESRPCPARKTTTLDVLRYHCLYVYVYNFMCVCMYVYVYMYTYINIYIYTYIYVDIYIYIYPILVYVSVHVHYIHVILP